MTYLRISRARFDYRCDKCDRLISRGTEYIRVEPFPIARIKSLERVEHLCRRCGIGNPDLQQINEDTGKWLNERWQNDQEKYKQLSFTDISLKIVETQVQIFDITPELIRKLIIDPKEIYNLTPVSFEELICNRLDVMGFGVKQVGSHTYQKDGGIDIIAWTKQNEFPFLMAIQAKYHHLPKYKTGSQEIRNLIGTIKTLPFHIGVLVTNTTFTPDAKWVATQQQSLIRLRDIEDVRRWLIDDFLDEYNFREIPKQIEVCPGVVIKPFRK